METKEGKKYKTIIIKIGSTSIVKSNGDINLEKIEELAKTLSKLKKLGKNVLLVSSGAIAVGAKELGFKERPRDVLGMQVTASVGQISLIKAYEYFFMKNNEKISQILLTRDVFFNDIKYKNFKNCLSKLFELNVIPIINENDAVAYESEDNYCDNDTLAGEICSLIKGDILILLSDIDGVYTKDPKVNKDAKLIKTIPEITKEIEDLADSSSSSFGTGGMKTKIVSAKKATEDGADTVICSSEDFGVILDILEGKNIGTLFLGKNKN